MTVKQYEMHFVPCSLKPNAVEADKPIGDVFEGASAPQARRSPQARPQWACRNGTEHSTQPTCRNGTASKDS